GASGSGHVTSSVPGINCTITNGAVGSSGCSAAYPTGQALTLTSTAASGSYLKAWAGAGCDAAGTGVGSGSGTCAITMDAPKNVVTSFDQEATVAALGKWDAPTPWPAVAIHAHLLPDGRVLTWSRSSHAPVLWNPVSPGSFGGVAEPADLFCSGHTFLPDGRLLVAGGHSGTDNQGIKATEIFDYRTSSWTSGPDMQNGRWYPTNTSLASGEVLTLGGGSPTSTAEVIDISSGTGTWRSVASMAVARRQMNATLLADGTVLVTGGTNASGFNTAPTDDRVLAAELWNPTSEKWTTLARMTHYRLYHSTALLLPDGRILSVGSGQPAATGLTDDLTAEFYSPPYLFNADGTAATRPAITSAPTTVGYGQAFSVQTPSASSIGKVTWIRIGSVTHSFNQNQRLNDLTYSVSGSGALSVTAPASANLAPPGDYLLFVVDTRGVPSVAKIV